MIPHSTVSFPVDTFVTQTLVSPNGRFLFVEAATLLGTPGGNTVNTFRIRSDGSLTAAPGGPSNSGDNAPVLLGAIANPNYNIVYTGFTSAGQVGVFTYDATGRTAFVGAVDGTGGAPCWCTISANGRVLYVADTTSDAVSAFSLADPLHPVQIQELQLAGPTSNGAGGSTNEIAIDPTGKYLYAVTQSTDPSFPQGNQLHTLMVARDGTLSEPNAPVILSLPEVPANAHPQGLAMVELRGSFFLGDPFSDDGRDGLRNILQLSRGREFGDGR